MSAVGVVFIAQPHLPDAAAKQGPERFGKVAIDGFEGFQKLLARDLVDFADGLRGVFDGSQQVLALRVEKGEALFGFLEFFQRHHVDRSQILDARLELRAVLLPRPASASPARTRLRASIPPAMRGVGVQFIAALLRVVGVVGFRAGQRHFRLRALLAVGFEVPPAPRQCAVARRSRCALDSCRFLFDAVQFDPRCRLLVPEW